MRLDVPGPVRKMLDVIAPECKDLVDAIEASPAHTQDHWGDYLACLASIAADKGDMAALVTAAALLEAGANKRGVVVASSLLGLHRE